MDCCDLHVSLIEGLCHGWLRQLFCVFFSEGRKRWGACDTRRASGLLPGVAAAACSCQGSHEGCCEPTPPHPALPAARSPCQRCHESIRYAHPFPNNNLIDKQHIRTIESHSQSISGERLLQIPQLLKLSFQMRFLLECYCAQQLLLDARLNIVLVCHSRCLLQHGSTLTVCAKTPCTAR